MVEIKNIKPVYKYSYWKKPTKPLFWNAKTREKKAENTMTQYGLTAKYTKGIEIKSKGINADKKMATEVPVKRSYKPKTLSNK